MLMTQASNHPIAREQALIFGGICLVAFIVIGSLTERVSPPVGLINITPSEPLGLYIRTGGPATRGALIAFRPPAISRYVGDGHLARMQSFLKQVAATGGDQVCSDTKTILINQRSAGLVHTADAVGRSLPHWSGCRTLLSGEVFVLSNRVPNSFDSRYFGPVTIDHVLGVYRPVWVMP